MAAETLDFNQAYAESESSGASVDRPLQSRGWRSMSLVCADCPRGTADRRRHSFRVTQSSVAAAVAHDGLPVKAVKQFDEAAFPVVSLVEGRQDDFKFVLAFL